MVYQEEQPDLSNLNPDKPPQLTREGINLLNWLIMKSGQISRLTGAEDMQLGNDLQNVVSIAYGEEIAAKIMSTTNNKATNQTDDNLDAAAKEQDYEVASPGMAAMSTDGKLDPVQQRADAQLKRSGLAKSKSPKPTGNRQADAQLKRSGYMK